MIKHLSVYMLNLRRVIYKVLLIIVLMCAFEAVLLYNGTKNFFEYADELYDNEYMDESSKWYMRSSSLSITEVFTDSKAQFIFLAAFAALCGVIVANGFELGGSRSSYTVRRLSAGGKVVVIWESLAYLTCIVLLYGAQVAVSAGFVALYNHLGGAEYYSSQSALLMFYENEFLHSLMPLRDSSRMVRNVIMMLSIAVCGGCFAYRRRHGAKGWAIVVAAVFTVLEFPLEMGRWGTDVLNSLVLLTIALIAVKNLWGLTDEE